MMAYLAMMAPRLLELRRVLKPTGSIYLHCDPTASHYLKMLMDASLWRPTNFRNEIIWKRTSAHSDARRFAPVHDRSSTTCVVWSAWAPSSEHHDQCTTTLRARQDAFNRAISLRLASIRLVWCDVARI